MKHVLVALAALAMMLAVRSLGFSDASGGVDPRTLAAIGFVIVASFSVGGLVAELSLPKIIGYIVTGIALGPALSDILSVRVVREMQVFNTLALGLIALGAGLELDLKSIVRVWKTLFSTVLVKVPLLVVAMGGAFLLVHHVHPLLPLSDAQAVALALIISVLGIGTSPAIALAVVRETNAKGRLTDILLAMVVVKDLVVVIGLAIAIAVVRATLDPSASLSVDVLAHVGREIGGSMLLGALLAILLVAYVRFVHREMLLAITALILLAAEISSHFHLELLLVFITVGFIVRNFSKYEHEVLEPLERVALPVFVVFFTTAGAALDVMGVLRLLPLGIALVVARGVVYIVASRIGGAIGGESDAVKKNAWLAYIPQAGVTLGLVLLASRSLPTLSSEIASTGMAMVGLNLLVGPVLLGLGLKRTGDIRGGAGDGASAAAPVHESPSSSSLAREPTAIAAPPPVRAWPRNAELRRELEALDAALDVRMTRFVDTVLVPHLTEVAEQAAAHLRETRESVDERGHATSLARRLLAESTRTEQAFLDEAAALVVDLAREVEVLPEVREVRLDDADLAVSPGDGVSTRLARALVRTLSLRRRRVPLRVLARTALDVDMPEAVVEVLRATTWSEVAVQRELKDVLEGARLAGEASDRIEGIVASSRAELRRTLDAARARAISELAAFVDDATIPGLRRPVPRLSSVQARADALLHGLPAQLARLAAHAQAAVDTVRAEAALFVLTERLSDVRRTRLAPSIAHLIDEIVPELELTRANLADIEREMGEGELDAAALRALAQRTQAALLVRSRGRIRRATARHRRDTQANVLFAELVGALPTLPERVTLLPSLEQRRDALSAPVQVQLVERVRERLEAALHKLQELNQPVLDVALPFASQVEDAIQVAAFSFELAARAKDAHEDAPQSLQGGLARAVHHLTELERSLVERVEAAASGFEAVIEDTMRDLEELARVRVQSGELVRTSVRATRRLFSSRADELARSFRAQITRAAALLADVRARTDVDAYWSRASRERVDATVMRAALRRQIEVPDKTAIPPIYAKLFDQAPLDDARLLATHKAEVDEIVGRTSRGRASPARVLVVGEPGSGRTTIVQALLRRLSGLRVIVLDPAYHPRELGVVGAIAEELGVAADVTTVAGRLASEPTVVLVDDLERHLPTGAAFRVALDGLRLLLRETSTTTHFIVHTETVPLRLMDELTSLSSSFERVIRLLPLDAARVREVVELRRRLTGLELVFDQGIRLFSKRATSSTRPERRYYEWLASASRGNLRSALILHLQSVHAVVGERVEVRPVAAPRLAFLRYLPPMSVATLALLCRHGALEAKSVAQGLLVDEAEAGAQLGALVLTGLVTERAGFDSVEFEVTSAAAPLVIHELERAGVLPGGGR